MDNAQPEPSMEEILASIRRIISEDEEDAGPAKPAETAKPQGLKKPDPAPAASPFARKRDEDAAKPHLETEDLEMLKKNVAEATAESVEESILDQPAAAAASEAFRSLSQTVRVNDGDGKTLEDIVVAMLNPMIKEWLNANLPAIVEEKVEEEVQRVARRRRG
jgi:cell pole-organizing protein PopZ